MARGYDPAQWHEDTEAAVRFVQELRVADTWQYWVSAAATEPIAIASATAVSLLAFLGRLDAFTADQRRQWADYLQSFQSDDGLFRDEVDLAEPTQHQPDWALLLHRTRHCIWAIEALTCAPIAKPLHYITSRYAPGEFADWLDQVWHGVEDGAAWRWGNWAMDIGVCLDVQQRHFGDTRARQALDEMFDWLDAHLDPATGFWPVNDPDLRNAMAGAMHLYPLYWAYGRTIPHYEQAVRATLSLQQDDGLFAYESGNGGSQCLDYDAVLVLANAYWQDELSNLHEDIRQACARVLEAIVVNRTPAGSWADCQSPDMRWWATRAAAYRADQGSLWDTYARMMTVAMCHEVCTGQPLPDLCAEHHLFEIFHAGRNWREGVSPVTCVGG